MADMRHEPWVRYGTEEEALIAMDRQRLQELQARMQHEQMVRQAEFMRSRDFLDRGFIDDFGMVRPEKKEKKRMSDPNLLKNALEKKPFVMDCKKPEIKMLPCEASAKAHLDRFVVRDNPKLRAKGYKPFSLEPLTWRGDGFPKLYLLPIDEEGMSLGMAREGGASFPHSSKVLPKRLAAMYEDVANWGRTVNVSFRGLIPQETRNKIEEARKSFDGIFLLCDESTLHTVKTKADPLVLGWDGSGLWLIDAFDATPIEEYIAKEFTV